MRSFLLFLGLLVTSVCFAPSLSAQVEISINSSCSAITVVQDDLYDTNIFTSAHNSFFVRDNVDPQCGLSVTGTASPPRYSLEKQQSNGSFTKVVGPQFGKTFSVNSNGVYRVRAEYPRPIQVPSISCPGSIFRIAYAASTGRILGFVGAYDPLFSNSVVFGTSSNADVNISFANDFNNNAAYDLSTDVLINTAGTINHVRWKVYIWEAGGNWTNRYETPFFNGQIPPELSVNFLLGTGNVGPYTFSGFQPFKSYKIHVGVQGNCGGWGFKELQWFYCPTGLGCRPNLSETALVVTPNPVQTYFHLVGDSEQERSSNQRVFIRDLSGRTVKEFYRDQIDRYEVGDLQTGIYIIQIIDPTAGLVYSSKMVKR